MEKAVNESLRRFIREKIQKFVKGGFAEAAAILVNEF